MAIGIIDIGSNTIKLIVGRLDAYEKLEKLYEKSLPVRLGSSTFETGLLSPRSIQNGVEAISFLAQEARNHGAEEILAYATSAVRSAKNKEDFLTAVKNETKLTVKILTGEEEAELIFCGVCTDSKFKDNRIWVVDVGGGSVELILGMCDQIEKKVSLDIGSVRLMTMFYPTLPTTSDVVDKMMHYLQEQFQNAVLGWNLETALPVATGGSACCISRWKGESDNRTITYDLLVSVIDEIQYFDLERLKSDKRIPAGRGEVLLAGAVTYACALKTTGKKEFLVSERNLRYGLIFKALNQRKAKLLC